MAIFSTKKNKKDGSQASPPLGQGGAGGPGGAFPRSQSGSQGMNPGVAAAGGASSTIPSSLAHPGQLQQSPYGSPAANIPPLSSQQQAPLSSSTSSGGPPPAAPSHTVLYPWAQRRLQLLPSALLPPPDPLNPTAVPIAIAGPPSAPPFPRYGHSVNPVASAATGDLYVFGGLVQNAVKNDLYVLNCSSHGQAPSSGPNAPLSVGLVETRGEVPGQRVGHASVGVGNVLIVWGGDTKSRPEDRQDDGLYLLNLSTKEWTRVKTIGPNPEGRYGHAAAMVGSKFFVFGGQKDDGGFMNDLAWFDLQKLKAGSPKWTFVDYTATTVVPPKRTGHTTVTHGDCIYVFGGTDGQYHYNDTWCFDTNTGLWTELSCIGYIPVPREGHAATLVDDVMYVFGGRGVDGKDLEDLAAFKITNQRWFMFQNMGPAPSGRSGHAMATWQNKVFVLGGESYTSQRADDPSFVHVLDTSKIKYPADSSRQTQHPVSRKSSIPVISPDGSPAVNGSNPSSPPAPSSEFRSIPEDDRRAASPTGSARNGGIGLGQPSNGPLNSFGQVIAPQQQPNGTNAGVTASQSNSKIAKRATTGATSPPLRPNRPGDDDSTSNRRTMDPSNMRYEQERSTSPTTGTAQQQQRPRVVSPALNASPAGSGRSAKGSNTNGTPPMTSAAAFPRGDDGRSPSPNQLAARAASSEGGDHDPPTASNGYGSPLVNGGAPPQDAFYYGSRASPPQGAAGRDVAPSPDTLKAKDDEIASLRAREAWMRTALALATRKGFVAPEGNDSFSDPALVEGNNREVVEALLQLKQELAQAKISLADQARTVDDRIAGASKARIAALQEASYYRAKLVALESGSVDDVGRLERDRSADLETRLAEALATRSLLERQVTKLEAETAHHSEMRLAAEERHTAATTRADAAENSYSRSLTDYADLQRRAHGHETSLSDHAERLATLTSSSARASAENAQLKEELAAHQTSVTQHLRALEETQVALAAANARSDEIHSVWENAQSELTQHQSRAMQLQADLDAKNLEHTAATAKAADLERILKSTRDAHQATQVLASGGLAELIAARSDTTTRAIPTDGDAVHAERLRAVEEESSTIKRLHQEARVKNEATIAELGDVRGREVQLQGELVQLRSELASIRAQHAQALEEVGRHRSLAFDREGEAREAARAKEASEVKAGLLRNLMSDHGLSVTDEDLATRYPPMSGTESAEQLHRRAQELQGHLEQQTKATQELEAAHEDVRKQLDELRNASPVGNPEDTERATKAEAELEALQGRHRQLEGTHLKAVQYVKGTEKMLRRMKEELTRYKERCEELESPDRALPPEHLAELESLRQQATTLKTTSEQSAVAVATLERQVADHEKSRAESDGKVKELSDELSKLDQALEKAHHDLEETLAVNASLNQELTAALKNPTSPRGKSSSDDLSRLEAELTQAQNKSEWLKRENAQLEARCRTAESKITILLDHMEGEQQDDDNYDLSAGEESQPWNKSERGAGSGSDAGSDYSADGDRPYQATQHR